MSDDVIEDDGQGLCLFSKRMGEQRSHHGMMASSERQVRLAEHQDGVGEPDPGATLDAVGGHRLATTGADMDAVTGRINRG